MTSYKKIIENRVLLYVERFIEKKAATEEKPYRFAHLVEGSFSMTPDKDIDHPYFSVKYTVSGSYGDYEVHGYVDDYGDVTVTSVTFDRMICQEKDADGWWITESAKPVHEFLFGKALDEFCFDR